MPPSICERLSVDSDPPRPGSTLGLAVGTLNRAPINGLRHPPTDTTNGWFIWGGEGSDADDFFSPVHVEHMATELPLATRYLDLPPGHRFQIDRDGHEDVWFDPSLLDPA